MSIPNCSPGESFGDLHPELLDEYDESNDIDPFAVFPNCKDTVNWVCRNDKSHTWEASFALRNMGHGKCPICYTVGRDLTKESIVTAGYLENPVVTAKVGDVRTYLIISESLKDYGFVP